MMNGEDLEERQRGEEERRKREDKDQKANPELESGNIVREMQKALERFLDGISKLISPKKSEDASSEDNRKKDSKANQSSEDDLSIWETFKKGVKKLMESVFDRILSYLTDSSDPSQKSEGKDSTNAIQKEDMKQSREFLQKLGTQVETIANTFSKALDPTSKMNGEKLSKELTAGFEGLRKLFESAPKQLKQAFADFMSEAGNFVGLLGTALKNSDNKGALQEICNGLTGFAKGLNALASPEGFRKLTSYGEEMQKAGRAISGQKTPLVAAGSSRTLAARNGKTPLVKPDTLLMQSVHSFSL